MGRGDLHSSQVVPILHFLVALHGLRKTHSLQHYYLETLHCCGLTPNNPFSSPGLSMKYIPFQVCGYQLGKQFCNLPFLVPYQGNPEAGNLPFLSEPFQKVQIGQNGPEDLFLWLFS